MAQGKKRVGNVKAAAKRVRSWNKNQAAKKLRVAEQDKRHAHNVEVGSTGKQRANLAAKAEKHRLGVVKKIAEGFKAKQGT